ncbi:hypothetical protein LQZ18_18360 [Lachnospiraceae bacterium ZAX-1]
MKKAVGIIALAAFIGGAAFGASQKFTYTNITRQSDSMDYFKVAEFPEEFVESVCLDMKEDLAGSNMILRVRGKGERKYSFLGNFIQLVQVEKVYKGDDIKIHDELYLYRTNWQTSFTGDVQSVELGFSNYIREGKEYLVFIEGKVDSYEGEEHVYQLLETTIAPVFCYEDFENRIIPIPEETETTYIDYRDVAENEFFAATEKTLDALLQMKAYWLEFFPSDT